MTQPVVVSSETGMFFLSSICTGSWPSAYLALNGTSTYEMLRLLDQIDRDQLADFLDVSESMKFSVYLPRILFAASVVVDREVWDGEPRDVTDAREFLAKRSPLRIPRDPTGILPRPVPDMPGLSDDDYENGAELLGVEVAAVKAVAYVESGGRTGFGPDGRPIVRYELHIFQGSTKSKYHVTHPHLSQSYQQGKKYHVGGQPNEWSMLYGAMLLRGCLNQAIAAASWGMFQIMGFNHKASGYGTPQEMASDMCLSAGNQLQAFLQLCKSNGYHHYLAKKDWAGFAKHYNGASYKDNNYDVHLAAAYGRYAAEE
jgi:hypothetical protein